MAQALESTGLGLKGGQLNKNQDQEHFGHLLLEHEPFYSLIYCGCSKRASGSFCTEVIEFSGYLQYVGVINPLHKLETYTKARYLGTGQVRLESGDS